MLYTGKVYDTMGRLTAMKCALLVKVTSVSLGYLACARLLFSDDYNYDPNRVDVTLYSIPIFCALANLSFSTVSMAIQKDWIIVLSARNNDWLLYMNSVMTQIDLASKSLAPTLTGFVFAFFSYGVSSVFMLTLNGLVTLLFFVFLSKIYHSFPALWDRRAQDAISSRGAKSSNISASAARGEDSESGEVRVDNFLTSGCASTMFSYSILYFTVLSFGSLMTVYLM